MIQKGNPLKRAALQMFSPFIKAMFIKRGGANRIQCTASNTRQRYLQAYAALEWLASMHACFWEQPTPAGVWEQGCYWYLDTRQALV